MWDKLYKAQQHKKWAFLQNLYGKLRYLWNEHEYFYWSAPISRSALKVHVGSQSCCQ